MNERLMVIENMLHLETFTALVTNKLFIGMGDLLMQDQTRFDGEAGVADIAEPLFFACVQLHMVSECVV